VLFSAAIPFQGGAGHVNEQWPSYWAALFAKHDYVAYDVVRPAVWEDDRVAFWYAQNMILYVDRAHAPALRTDVRPKDPPRDLVHPALHIRDHTTPKRAPAPPSLSRLVRDVPGATRRAVRTRLSKLARVVPSQRRVKGLGGARGRRRLQIRKLLAPLVRGSVVLTTADGLKLRITSDPVDEQIAQHLLGPRRPDYFPALSLPDGPCILDIGAHHGLYAAAALHTYRGSQIICVEPSANALEALYANLRLNNFNGRARVVRAGLATRSGSGELRHTAEGSWGASLFEDPADAHESETVALQTLDEILAGSRPDVLKCNAEGAEYALFDQLAESDLRPAFMLVMVHPEFGDLDRLLAQAEAMGYAHERIGTADHPAFHMTRSM
jgi:FkbM family methyltransferase